MVEEQQKLTKENVLDTLFNSFNYGNLGLFIGAGFSKAAVNDDSNHFVALSWGELIDAACKELEVEVYDEEKIKGMSYPQIATQICEKISNDKHIPYEDAKRMLKETLCNLTNWLPNKEKTRVFSELLEQLNPSWIITTNYDLVIEKLLTGKSITLGPDNYLTNPKGIIPIYHLHGVRRDPESIIITQEDYVRLFRPNEYRQIKLALTIKESTTLILGYGLGDVNVLSAVDWSKNIYKESNEYPHEIIQAIRTENPSTEPYRDQNGIIIIEISDIRDFLQEVVDFFKIKKEEYNSRLEKIEKLIGKLSESKEELIDNFIRNQKIRLGLLHLLSEFEIHMISPYINFISRCIDKTWDEAAQYGAFRAYDKNLKILMDIITNYEYKQMPPALFEFVAYSLDRVFRYVCDRRDILVTGKSWSATETWHLNKKDIPHKMVEELYHYSKRNFLSELHRKIKPLFEED
jgi:hypothetical protein